jgi:hypothetical protein
MPKPSKSMNTTRKTVSSAALRACSSMAGAESAPGETGGCSVAVPGGKSDMIQLLSLGS